MKILTVDEVRQAEREALSQRGISTLVLMERAGHAVAQFCLVNFKFDSVCVVCGKGNNGGDGMVAAEALRQVVSRVSVIILAKDASGLGADAVAMCKRLGVQPIWAADTAAFESDKIQEALKADLIIDAIFGTGFRPPLGDLARRAVDAINDASGTVVSVDLPTGVDADTMRPHESGENIVFAHGIATFIAPKPAHVFGDLTTGPIAVSEIGAYPASISNHTGMQVITGQDVSIAFPPRPRDANKGTFGHVLVIAGSVGKAGAAGLASQAALRTGAGLVTVACPKSIQATVAGFAPEVMTEALAQTADGTIAIAAMSRVEALLAGKQVVVLGPGLSQNGETAEFARRLVAECRLPLVLDADGLNAFDRRYGELKPPVADGFRVLTPHPGEAARLLAVSVKDIQANRTEMARRIARETGSCVVLKGSKTLVAGVSGETWINMSGNPALAKGGTGDVLSGMIAAALARKPSAASSPGGIASSFPKEASIAAAVHLHGLAGDFGRDMLHENTVLARDIPGHLSEAFRDCEQQMKDGLFYLQK